MSRLWTDALFAAAGLALVASVVSNCAERNNSVASSEAGPSSVAPHTFRGSAVLEPGYRILDIQANSGSSLAYATDHGDGGFELRVVDLGAVRVYLPDGGICR